jgi:hypothetical protein
MAVLVAGVILLASVGIRAQSDFTRAGDPAAAMEQRLGAAREAAMLEPFMSDYTTRAAILSAQDLANRGRLDDARRVLLVAYLADRDDALVRASLQDISLTIQVRDAREAWHVHPSGGPDDVVPASTPTP